MLPDDRKYVAGELPELTEANVMRTIAVDFDGVIHAYTRGWRDGAIYDPPVPGAREGIARLCSKGFLVIVFTAASRKPGKVMEWLAAHDIRVDAVSNLKPPAIAYVDDRAIRFTNWPDVVKYFA